MLQFHATLFISLCWPEVMANGAGLHAVRFCRHIEQTHQAQGIKQAKSDTGPQRRAVRADYSLLPFKKMVLIKGRFQERFVGGSCVADGKSFEAAWKKNRRVPLLLFSDWFWCVSNPVWGMPEYSWRSSQHASGCIWHLGTSHSIVLLWWLRVVKSLHNSLQPSLIWK